VLVLNGTEIDNKGNKEWQYVYPIESRFKNLFTFQGSYSFVFAVFDCCRSVLKNRETLTLEESETLDYEPGTTRGSGSYSTGFNFLFVNGCLANSVVKDKNPLVRAITQEFRACMEKGELEFPYCLINLPKRYQGCML